MDNRREFLQRALALIPASIIGRGFLKSANVPKAVKKSDTPFVEPRFLSATNFPDGWHLYETCGQSLFPMYGASGGLCTQTMAYLLRKKPIIRNYADLPFDERWKLGRRSGTYAEYVWQCIPLEFSDLEFIATDYDEQGLKRLINLKIAYAIKNRTPQPINMNGGNFPRVTTEEREREAVYFRGVIEKRGYLEPMKPPENLDLYAHLTGVYPRLYGRG